MKASHDTNIRSIILCGMFSALIAVGAFIRITLPTEPYAMHFTLQWFFVLMAALLLGARRAVLSVLVYLLIGLIGLPVFASGGGFSYILRPTFGFLLGFLPAAYVTGHMTDAMRPNRFRGCIIACVCGLIIDYAMGMLYYFLIGTFLLHYSDMLRLLLINCLLLTIGGDFVLCLLAAWAAFRIRGILKKENPDGLLSNVRGS